MSTTGDLDPTETSEWVDALSAVRQHRGNERTNYLLNRLVDEGRREGVYVPRSLTTAYCNTIPPEREEKSSGDRAIEHRLRSIIRWNAMAIILRANKDSSELGGHIASFQSAATLYDIGFGHFWHAPTDTHGGDLLFIQGHSSPGIYARAFLEGRLSEEQLLNYRQETDGNGIPSYPHPWLMPDFWQFPTVSMGLGPLMAIYQARFLKYLHGRGLADTATRKVWAFMGDGEMDEPESLGAISLAGRENLDNLDLRHQLQPAAPRRPGARQRQDRPGARERVPRRRLERHQGALGQRLGRAARQGQERQAAASAWKSASTASTRTSRARAAPTCASTSSASTTRRGRSSPT